MASGRGGHSPQQGDFLGVNKKLLSVNISNPAPAPPTNQGAPSILITDTSENASSNNNNSTLNPPSPNQSHRFTLGAKRNPNAVGVRTPTIISQSRSSNTAVKPVVSQLLVDTSDPNRLTMTPDLPEKILKIIRSAKVASVFDSPVYSNSKSQSVNNSNSNNNSNNNNNTNNYKSGNNNAPNSPNLSEKSKSILSSPEQTNLKVLIPDHSLICTVVINTKMVVDDLIDALIHILHFEHLIDLRGYHEQAVKEFFGLYLPSQNIWCRKEKKLEDYSIFSSAYDIQVELRLKTKYKNDKKNEAEEIEIQQKFNTFFSVAKNKNEYDRRKKFELSLPELSLTYTVECDPSCTAREIIEGALEKRAIDGVQSVDDYGLHVHLPAPIDPTEIPPVEKDPICVLLDKNSPLSSIAYDQILFLQCKRIAQKIVVKINLANEKEFRFHPDRKILELVQYIVTCEKLPRNLYGDAKLKFRPTRGPTMLLDPNRSLRSYRLAPTDKLELVSDNYRSSIKPVGINKKKIVKIICPEFNIERTLQVSENATIAEVIYRFSKKVVLIENIALYGLFTHKSSINQLSVSDTITTLDLKELFLKKHNSKPNEVFKEKLIFGVDPARLEFSVVGDSKIPTVLYELQKAIYAVKALDVEGIFREPGNILKRRIIEEELLGNSFPSKSYAAYDPHDIACVIKNWFERLPVSLFDYIEDDDFNSCLIDEDECLELAYKIAEPYSSIFLWVIELMFEVSKNCKINEMDIYAIAKHFAPVLQKRSNDKVKKVLLEKQSATIISSILERLLSEWGRGVHGGAMKSKILLFSLASTAGNKFMESTII